MDEFVVKIPKLHSSQKEIYQNKKRFNVIRNGRRWGKTKMAMYLATKAIAKGKAVALFVPTYEFGEEFWEEIKERLEVLTTYKSESKHILRTNTQGSLKIWSLEKKRSGRGRKYDMAIIDEAAFAKDLKESWTRVIRATLTDLIGDAWFFSTPNGRGNYFFDLCNLKDTHEHWAEFHYPTKTNPYISTKELEEIKNELDELTWLQEFEAEFIDFTGRPFSYSFDSKVHVGEAGKPKISLPLDLSFDFNVDPITCIAAQHSEDKKIIRIHKEFRLKNSDIYELCDAIIAEYGDNYYFRVTGDASGNNRSAMVSDNLNYYRIIAKRLKLQLSQFFVPGANPRHRNSRVLVNSLFKRHGNIIIDNECKYLIADNKFVQCNESGEIDKNSDKHQSHLLDCFAGDTLITTINGQKRIDKIVNGDLVLTRNGYKKVIDNWSSESIIYQFELSDGNKIKCTKDHKFYTNDFRLLEILSIFEQKLTIWKLSTIQENINLSEELNITKHHTVKNIDTEDCISKNGLTISEKYQKDFIFIIKMAINLIMNWIISNVSKVRSTVLNICKKGLMKIQINLKMQWLMQGSSQINGTEVKKELSGIKNMQKILDLESLNMENRFVLNALRNILKKLKNQNSAQINVNHLLGENQGSMKLQKNVILANQNLKQINTKKVELTAIYVNSVKKIGIQKVYDITIEGEHEFFANGILVHNCMRYYYNTWHSDFLKKYNENSD